MANDNSIFDKMIEMGMGMTMAREMSRMTENAMHSNNQYPQQAPPPIHPTSQIYAAINNTQAGPFSEQEIMTLIKKGMITNATLVWKPGLPNWVPASQVPEVGKLLLLYSK
ncbi:MAG: DUF4339 domain-containing protein [Bacteroidales bacterium]|nr:DUF4339 domain-containing protein [Bacteroidales bacterium]